MNGDEVRNVKFGRGGYDAAQVNDLLARIAEELDAGRPAGPLIANATFKSVVRKVGGHSADATFKSGSRRGYDTGTVDWFLDQLRRREDPSEEARRDAGPWRDLDADPYRIHREPDGAARITTPGKDECADAWRDFGLPPGTQLSWAPTGALRRELRTADLQTVASFRGTRFLRKRLSWSFARDTRALAFTITARDDTFTAGGRTFTPQRVTDSTWRGIAETTSRDRLGIVVHLERPPGEPDLHTQLNDEAGTPVLYVGGEHYNRAEGAYIKFPGKRWLRFPVRGTKRANAVMTAVDQAGNNVARYRLTGRLGLRSPVSIPVEITVHPGQQLTDELTLAIAVSAPWLASYFDHPAEGGGG